MHMALRIARAANSWRIAFNILEGKAVIMSWLRKGSQEEDRVVAHANETLLEGAANADLVNLVENKTKTNLRDQLTVEEAEAMHEEIRLRRFGFGRN